LAYTPDDILSWGSIHNNKDEVDHDKKSTTRAKDECKGKCTPVFVDRYYPERYLHDELMLETPGLLPGLRNTPRFREVPNKPLTFVTPRFIHTKQRSQYHLLVSQHERDGLCQIAGNLQREQEYLRTLMLRASTKGQRSIKKSQINIPRKSRSLRLGSVCRDSQEDTRLRYLFMLHCLHTKEKVGESFSLSYFCWLHAKCLRLGTIIYLTGLQQTTIRKMNIVHS
jgi:hypothetical protein